MFSLFPILFTLSGSISNNIPSEFNEYNRSCQFDINCHYNQVCATTSVVSDSYNVASCTFDIHLKGFCYFDINDYFNFLLDFKESNCDVVLQAYSYDGVDTNVLESGLVKTAIYTDNNFQIKSDDLFDDEYYFSLSCDTEFFLGNVFGFSLHLFPGFSDYSTDIRLVQSSIILNDSYLSFDDYSVSYSRQIDNYFLLHVDDVYYGLDDYVRSFTDNYDFGYSNGFLVGETTGYSNGYIDGYNEALEVDTTATTIFNGILNVALVPINFFLAIFNFEILGINLKAFISALLTIAVVVIIIKLIFGGKSD